MTPLIFLSPSAQAKQQKKRNLFHSSNVLQISAMIFPLGFFRYKFLALREEFIKEIVALRHTHICAAIKPLVTVHFSRIRLDVFFTGLPSR